MVVDTISNLHNSSKLKKDKALSRPFNIMSRSTLFIILDAIFAAIMISLVVIVLFPFFCGDDDGIVDVLETDRVTVVLSDGEGVEDDVFPIVSSFLSLLFYLFYMYACVSIYINNIESFLGCFYINR